MRATFWMFDSRCRHRCVSDIVGALTRDRATPIPPPRIVRPEKPDASGRPGRVTLSPGSSGRALRGRRRAVKRRDVLARIAGLVGGLWLGLRSGQAAAGPPAPVPVFKLDPEWGAGNPACSPDPHRKTHSCHACNTCHKHAANKLFATQGAANVGRAHKHCKCAIRSGTISFADYTAVFRGQPGKEQRRAVDLRWPGVAPILKPKP